MRACLGGSNLSVSIDNRCMGYNLTICKMSTVDYFQVYIDIIAEVFRRVKKSGIKKFAQIREIVDTA